MALDPEQDKRYVGPAPDEETQQKTVQWDLVTTLGRQLHLLQFNIVGNADVPFSSELSIHRLWHPNYRLPLFLWKPSPCQTCSASVSDDWPWTTWAVFSAFFLTRDREHPRRS